ncbi:DNA translocase FtsK, partial [Bacteroidota bacterium]
MEEQILLSNNELSGKIGDFLGAGLGRLLGGIGSILMLTSLLLTSFIIAFDINLSRIISFIQMVWKGMTDDKEIGKSEVEERDLEFSSDDLQRNGKKEKKKRISKEKKKRKFAETVEESSDETRIRILKKEQLSEVIDPNLGIQSNTSSVQIYDSTLPKSNDTNEKKMEDLPEQWEEVLDYKSPGVDLLDLITDEEIEIPETELKRNAELLKEKLSLFDIKIDDISVTPGPVVTLYEIVPAPGVKISRIVSLQHDIALALAARGIRIIAPIPGKSAIGVEIPNDQSILVKAKSVISKLSSMKLELPLALGKTISGDVYITDLSTMPHLLIAGSTGSGKSVGINMMIMSLIYTKHPSDIKFLIIDPKKIELSFYTKLNKHFLAVSPDLTEEIITAPQNALLALKSVEFEMEKRYDKLAKVGVRNIIDYNKKIENPRTRPADSEKLKHYKLPYIIIIIDELADLILTSGREVEEPIARLAQLARAVGIHLILATQRPSVNVITGVIKANFSARIAYQVATRIDSRTILDMNGAEQLLGRGDMLFLPGGMPKPIRIQNAFISVEEIERVTNFIYVQKGYSKRYLLPSMFEKKSKTDNDFLSDLDPMFADAARVIVIHQQGSVSLLQRRLKLGYSRAARIVDQLELAGIVGPSEGSKAREVKVDSEEELETIL